jgi:hypothetical protein
MAFLKPITWKGGPSDMVEKRKFESYDPEEYPINQWYYDPYHKCTYWYGPPREKGDVPPDSPTANAKHRAISIGDRYAAKNITDNNQMAYYHILSRVTTTAIKDYPSNPTFKELYNLQLHYKTSDLIIDNQEGISLVRLATKNITTLYTLNLVRQGQIVLQWAPDNLMFQMTPPDYEIPERYISFVKKYAGERFECQLRDNVWGISYENNWVALHHGLKFNTDDNVWLCSKSYDNVLKVHNKTVTLIKDYISSITPKKIVDAFGSTNPGDFFVFRCQGCINADQSHVRMHIARGDLNTFFIYLALREFGNEEPNNAPWKLLHDVQEHGESSKYLELFKKVYETFLIDCLCTRSSLLTEHPTHGRHAKGWNGGKWAHSHKAHMQEGGIIAAPVVAAAAQVAELENLINNFPQGAFPVVAGEAEMVEDDYEPPPQDH